ncbi:MAG: bifunctional diaminohydroxyphosphoribosylaminopyrimidine deaminase/5-amino-6-(5-phosphoribosylamino)uracil reductase RibD [Myxococcales bacterium]|nr:bifunctional diaminohydroxyphosphoribosylaminopyrimidine deaminase/5-amino-6-(5-phosphoribosylamino)uracil reductase RibD [Myxococcales bacterium]
MRRAIARARRALHRTSPNPRVGCVVVADGQVVGVGVSAPPGGPHAEVQALQQAGPRARGADVYVTLEPCCHRGRTPPCTEALIAAGVARVFVGVLDENPRVAGGGVERLRAAGVAVEVGIEAEACAALHAPFFRHISTGRPWTLLKAAVTLDGRLATPDGAARWITGPEARRDGHKLRAWADAVMVGAATARLDDPTLNVREVRGTDPLRVVADPDLTVPPTARLLGPQALLLHAADADPERARALADTGATLVAVRRSGRGLDAAAMLQALGQRGIVSVLVEGGGRLHGSLLRARLADEACIYLAARIIGPGRPLADLPAVDAIGAGLQLADPSWTRLGADMRVRGRIVYPEEAPCSPD